MNNTPMKREMKEYLGLVQPGKLNLTKLKTRHRHVISMHLAGFSGKQICEETGYDLSYIYQILNDDLSKKVIDEFFKYQDLEYAALYQESVDAVRDCLKPHNDPKVRLQAATLYMKSHGKYEQNKTKENTAEDLVREIMELKIVRETPIVKSNPSHITEP